MLPHTLQPIPQKPTQNPSILGNVCPCVCLHFSAVSKVKPMLHYKIKYINSSKGNLTINEGLYFMQIPKKKKKVIYWRRGSTAPNLNHTQTQKGFEVQLAFHKTTWKSYQTTAVSIRTHKSHMQVGGLQRRDEWDAQMNQRTSSKTKTKKKKKRIKVSALCAMLG